MSGVDGAICRGRCLIVSACATSRCRRWLTVATALVISLAMTKLVAVDGAVGSGGRRRTPGKDRALVARAPPCPRAWFAGASGGTGGWDSHRNAATANWCVPAACLLSLNERQVMGLSGVATLYGYDDAWHARRGVAALCVLLAMRDRPSDVGLRPFGDECNEAAAVSPPPNTAPIMAGPALGALARRGEDASFLDPVRDHSSSVAPAPTA